MLSLSVTIEGLTESDLEMAIAEVMRLVGEGYLSGHDSNDTGNYHFKITENEDLAEEDSQ